MGYSREIYDEAMAAIEKNHARAIRESQQRKEAFYAQYPRAQELEAEMASAAVAAGKAIFNGAQAKAQLTSLKEKSLSLQEERARLLQNAGISSTYLEPAFTCPACKDTGFIDGKMCGCLKQRMRLLAYEHLNASTPADLCSFDDFSLDYYPGEPDDCGVSPKQKMEQIFQYCKQYAENFSLNSPNLLMQGGTGLGKTHLSLAIARKAIEKGYGVIYGSAQNIVTSLEKERFQRDNDRQDANHLLIQCDLLILDDLGTEFSTSFVTAAVYNIINTRLIARKPTIINTNLSMQELEERYTERFASRLLGSYVPLFFRGKDIRQRKRRKK